MSELGKAVFLSYASQDAAAVSRIAEALRAAGAEVWFDQNELVGGDAWDQKIRRQIKECALFVPVISANTNARAEGYFRLEWKLAVDRSHLLADDHPFLFPVVIDDTSDAAARVPDKFREVQWTRLNVKDTPESLARRVAKILGGGIEGGTVADRAPGQRPGLQKTAGSKFWRWFGYAWGLVGLLIGMSFVFRDLWPSRSREAKPAVTQKSADAPAPSPPAPVLSPARTLAAKGDALWLKANSDRSDHELAEDFYKQAVAADAVDGEVWAGYSKLASAFVYRGFDRSPERRELVRTTAEKAMRLAPDSPDAKLAAAGYQWQQRVNLDQIERTLREVRQVRPGDHSLMRFLSVVLRTEGKFDEGLALLDASAAAPGGDAIALVDKANALVPKGREEEASQAIDASLAQQPLDSALLFKVYFDLFIRGNREAALATYQALPEAIRITDRGAYNGTLVYLWNRQPEKAIALLRRVDRGYLNDFNMTPCGYWIGVAERQRGHGEAAAVEWRAALETVEQYFAKTPNRADLFMWRAKLHALLGESDEAERALRTYEQMLNYTYAPTRNMPGDVIDIYLALGRRTEVLEWIKTVTPKIAARFRPRWRAFLADNPQFDALRGNAEFESVVAGLKAEAASGGEAALASDIKSVMADKATVLDRPAPANKSVAVLAFADLSAAHDSEYFSDGISEELLSVLQKIPELKVIARASAFSFKGKNVPIPEIARQLGVAYVVDGSVRKADGKVRITAQLIKADDGFQLWNETFTRELKDVFSVQDEIAGLIAKNLSLKIGIAAARAPTVNAEAYQHLFQARFFSRQDNNDGWLRSVAECKAALALDPNFALAAAEMARSYIQLARFGGIAAEEGYRLARGPAELALKLDPGLAEAHDAMGWVQRTADWNWHGADASFRRAYELAPRNATMITDYAIVRGNQGYFDEARALGGAALELDPLNATTRGHYALFLGNFDENLQLDAAIAQIKRALELGPAAVEWHEYLARFQILQGRLAEAAASAELEPSERYRLVGRALVLVAQKQRPAAEAVLRELIEKYSGEMSFYIGEIYAFAGEADRAFEWLERARGHRDTALCWTVGAPFMRPITNDPRWSGFLKKLGHEMPEKKP